MSTIGHETESINVGGLKSTLQAYKTKYTNNTVWTTVQSLSVTQKDIATSNILDKTDSSGMKRVVLKKTDNFKTKVEGSSSNTVFVIQYNYTLTGNVTIPANCILDFQGGSLSGSYTLTGNNTGIFAAPKVQIFSGIDIQGSWNVPDIYTEWMEMSYSENVNSKYEMQSILRLLNNDIYQNVYLPNKPLYFLPKAQESGDPYEAHSYIVLKSHTHLHIPNVINVIPNSCTGYEVVFGSNVHDVIIDGGGTLIGDVENHTYTSGSTHEFGIGVYLYRTSNTIIQNLTAKKFTGDGFDIAGNRNSDPNQGAINVTLLNLISDSNRRQGLSLTATSDNIIIKGCKFINTGSILQTAPSTGIDIEPDASGMVVKNVFIEDCYFKNNYGGDLTTHIENIYNLNISDCLFEEYTEESGITTYNSWSLKFEGSHYNTTVNNCKLYGVIKGHENNGNGNYVSDIIFNNCDIKSFWAYGSSAVSLKANYIFKNCTINLNNEVAHINTRMKGFFDIQNNKTNLIFEDCNVTSKVNDYPLITKRDSGRNEIIARRCLINVPGIQSFTTISDCIVKCTASYFNIDNGHDTIWENNVFEIDNSSVNYLIGVSARELITDDHSFIINDCIFRYTKQISNYMVYYNQSYLSGCNLIVNNSKFLNDLGAYDFFSRASVYKSVTVNPMNFIRGYGTSLSRSNINDWFKLINGIWFDTTLNKPVFWTGSAWVDALGNDVSTVYPKTIGTPTSGNLAKFNGTDIEDAGKA